MEVVGLGVRPGAVNLQPDKAEVSMDAIVKQTREGKKYIQVCYASSLCDWGTCIAAAHAELGEGFKNLPVIATTRRIEEALHE